MPTGAVCSCAFLSPPSSKSPSARAAGFPPARKSCLRVRLERCLVNFLAAIRGQAVHDQRVRFGELHQRLIDLIAGQNFDALGGLRLPCPSKPRRRCKADPRLSRRPSNPRCTKCFRPRASTSLAAGWNFSARRCAVQSPASPPQKSTSSATLHAPSPMNATTLPAIGPRFSWNVKMSARIWHGCSSSVSALMVGMPE